MPGALPVEVSRGTCILHLTSSIGVSASNVINLDAALLNKSAEKGSSSVVKEYHVTFRISWTMW